MIRAEQAASSYPSCPTCGEENPREAVMCWACYTFLDGSLPVKFKCGIGIRANDQQILRSCGLAAFVLSGWLPRRLRYYALGAAVTSLAAGHLLKRREQRKLRLDETEPPVQWIVSTALQEAARINATAIRLQRFENGMRGDYEVDGAWREQMKVPGYMWEVLREEFLLRANDREKVTGRFGIAEAQYHSRKSRLEDEALEAIYLSSRASSG